MQIIKISFFCFVSKRERVGKPCKISERKSFAAYGFRKTAGLQGLSYACFVKLCAALVLQGVAKRLAPLVECGADQAEKQTAVRRPDRRLRQGVRVITVEVTFGAGRKDPGATSNRRCAFA